MAFDYRKLRGRIREKFGSEKFFSSAMGWSERTTSFKLNGIRPWKQQEIMRAIELLDLSKEDIHLYFFTVKVQNFELTR